MKQTYKRWKRWRRLLILGFIFPLLYSCGSYHYREPLPIDEKNIYEFPKEFLGHWIDKDDDDDDEYFVDKKYILFISNGKEKIAKGLWPKLDEKGNYLFPGGGYHEFSTIEYDSLKKPIDTINNFLLRGDYIYEYENKRYLNKGYPWYEQQDTIIVIKNDTFCIDLGQNAFLRKVNKNLYALNIRNRILGFNDEEFDDWWHLTLLKIKRDQTVEIWEESSKLKGLSCMFQAGSPLQNYYYSDCKWTKADIQKMFKDGYFEINNQLIRDTSRNITGRNY
ncbi:MAG TPA: hypothetical protein VF301_03105 [Ginsengibacter sp.]